jgi:Asp-tRNA(Asn)/Glu-tRNA(Gln) amidotransferase A subunit family amidase
MKDDDLCYMSAIEALARFRARTLSPVELVEAIISRAESISETINPFTDCYFDEARARARESEALFLKNNIDVRPLEGIPLAVKDMCDIAGKRTTNCSLIDSENIPSETTPYVQRLIQTGANVFARTTAPEFGWLFTTQSRMWGVTQNPWKFGISPGGSSGGSAAALAAGATTMATGSDTTGSIRQPASQCGVVGYQAPYGRFPMVGASSFNGYSNPGPMTRTVTDCALMANIMSGPDHRDHNSLNEEMFVPMEHSDLSGIRIAASMNLGFYEVSDDVLRETRRAIDSLRDAGAVVDEVGVEWAEELIELALGSQEFLFAGDLNESIAKHGDLVSDYVPQLAETANSYSSDDYRRSLTISGEVWRDHLGPLFHGYHAFVTPTTTYPDIPATGWQKDTVTVNGKQVTDTQTTMAVLWNMYNRCPVLAVPSGMTDSGLPTGIQIAGRPYDDPTVFRIAAALESRRPWLDCPERRPDCEMRVS